MALPAHSPAVHPCPTDRHYLVELLDPADQVRVAGGVLKVDVVCKQMERASPVAQTPAAHAPVACPPPASLGTSRGAQGLAAVCSPVEQTRDGARPPRRGRLRPLTQQGWPGPEAQPAVSTQRADASALSAGPLGGGGDQAAASLQSLALELPQDPAQMGESPQTTSAQWVHWPCPAPLKTKATTAQNARQASQAGQAPQTTASASPELSIQRTATSKVPL